MSRCESRSPRAESRQKDRKADKKIGKIRKVQGAARGVEGLGAARSAAPPLRLRLVGAYRLPSFGIEALTKLKHKDVATEAEWRAA